jgi:hypothetical protein
MLKTANQPIAGRCEWQLPERKAVRQNLFNVHFGVFIDFSITDPRFDRAVPIRRQTPLMNAKDERPRHYPYPSPELQQPSRNVT